MKCTYVIHATAICPKDASVVDRYGVEVIASDMILVERLLELANAPPRAEFQEEMTQRWAKHFNAKVRTTGAHSMVHTTCECEP